MTNHHGGPQRAAGARKATAPALYPPRNAKAAETARNRQVALIASFVGDDSPYREPTVYADPGRRYDWRCAARLPIIMVVRPGIDFRHAAGALLELGDLLRGGYPTVIDIDLQTVSAVVDGARMGQPELWPLYQQGSPWWQAYFPPTNENNR